MPDAPVSQVAGNGGPPFPRQPGKPFSQVGLSIWPCVVGEEKYAQALHHLLCDVVVDSSAQKWGVTGYISYDWDQVYGRR